MNKERIKSFILILLILNSIQLTLQMWFDADLWPNGYGFLDSVKNSPIVRSIASIFRGGDENLTGERLYVKTTQPRRIIVNGGGAREVYFKDSDDYYRAMKYVDAVMSDMLESDFTVTEIPYEDWKNLFKTKSLYVDYSYTMDGNSLDKIYGGTGTGKLKQIENFSGFIVIPDNVTSGCSVCVLNEETNSVYEYKFYSTGSGLTKFIEESSYQGQQNDAFAFEINLDNSAPVTENVQRNVVFSPLVLLNIPTGLEKETVLRAESVFESPEGLEEFAERAIGIFGHNASALRKKVQSDGTIIFVENNATIKFYYDGTIEYSAVSKENGLKISDGSMGCYQGICDVLNVTSRVWKELGANSKKLGFQLASPLSDNRDNKYKIKIDNIYNGSVIKFKNVCETAVEAEVSEGYITKLVIHLSNITETEQTRENPPVHLAIDSLYEKYGNRGMVIEDAFKCYDFEDDGKGYVKWGFKVKGDENTLVVDGLI